MPRVLTNGEVSIGAYKFPDRKRPMLCVEKGNQIMVYGSFHNDEQAVDFMNELGKLCGAFIEKDGADND